MFETILVLIHSILANLSFRSRRIGFLIKGKERQLIMDGELLMDEMKQANITTRDLLEAVRTTAKCNDLSAVREAFLERDGHISIIPK